MKKFDRYQGCFYHFTGKTSRHWQWSTEYIIWYVCVWKLDLVSTKNLFLTWGLQRLWNNRFKGYFQYQSNQFYKISYIHKWFYHQNIENWSESTKTILPVHIGANQLVCNFYNIFDIYLLSKKDKMIGLRNINSYQKSSTDYKWRPQFIHFVCGT